MTLYHGSYIEVDIPNLQVCLRTQEVLEKYLTFEGSEMV